MRRRVARAGGVEGGFEHRDAFVVDLARRASIVRYRGGDELLDVADLLGDRGGVEEVLAVGGISGLALGGAELYQQPAAQGFGIGIGAGELEGLAEPADGLVGCQRAERTVPGEARVFDGFVRFDGSGRGGPWTDALRAHPDVQNVRAVTLVTPANDIASRSTAEEGRSSGGSARPHREAARPGLLTPTWWHFAR